MGSDLKNLVSVGKNLLSVRAARPVAHGEDDENSHSKKTMNKMVGRQRANG